MKPLNIAVMISGSGSNLQALIDQIHKTNLGGNIALVLSNKEGVYGLRRAEENRIPAMVIHRKQYESVAEYEKALMKVLEEKEIDLIVLAGYLSFIPVSLIQQYKNRIMNIHPSLIPSFCGKGFYGEKVHEGVLQRGVKLTGATVHFVNEEMDGGPIIIQEAVAVDFYDTVETVQKKVLEIEHRILPLAVTLFIEGRLRVEGSKVAVLNS
ncbi:phosphoribosylglycinamide formyltransferase [Alkaliphilus oremlandii]|uniref:Phosphoribosylglycinamide formyltransferase n=1 Tax=Alkaliphilus oremlandii (strain OhILAs) TaxID=350688 RepID=A8MLI8_ALKOO|nr:phosphoribosylglycinamide formyltransferase [Alkaliphilus oremlandii]ABW18102.1 phosphoribosylglycinamide formyltransferase [Alkaliphilus oremlandii OhILAs]